MLGWARSWLAASRRRRRYALWAASMAVVAATVAAVVMLVPGANRHYQAGPSKGEGAATVAPVPPASVALSKTALTAARQTLAAFLQTAVMRRNLSASYDLVTPDMRKGYTRERWARGEIPVIPYPVDIARVRYQVNYSYAPSSPSDHVKVGLSIGLVGRKGSNAPPVVFAAELQAFDSGPRRRWLVSYWGPQGVLGGEPPVVHRASANEQPEPSHNLSTIWLIIPALIIGSIILVPTAYVLRSWLHARRIARLYSGR